MYNGVEKIIPLSTSAPLAALVFGAASLARVPWGTLLHAFASERELDSLGLADVSADLAGFVDERLRAHLAGTGDELRLAQAYETLSAISAEIDRVARLGGQDGGTNSDCWMRAAEQVIEREVEFWRAQEVVAGLTAGHEDELHQKFRSWSESLVAELFEGGIASAALEGAASDLLLLSFTRRLPRGAHSPRTGGIVVTGFGAKEFWPGHVVLQFDGVGLEGIRVWPGAVAQTQGPGQARVQAFAQDSGVETLMRGLHPRLRQMVGSAIVDAGLDRDVAVRALEGAESSWYEARTRGILETLDLMPAPALCEIAESLVALTALEHRLTGSLETVGGTISVGVLAPGEPLRWGKRPSLMSS